MIAVRNLTVRFGRSVAVDDLTLDVAPGGSLALWGENGAGKTTVLRAMLGLVPFEGEITVAGHDVRRVGRAARAAVGYVPQQLGFYDDMTALGLLRFIAGLRRAPAEQPAALLARVHLAEHAAKPVAALSGGMKQRLALAAALVGDPPVLVLDEPTASLDIAARADFTRLLVDLRAAGKTLVVTSHRLSEVTALAERVVVLDHGRERLACGASEIEAALYPFSTLVLVVAPGDMAASAAALAHHGFEVHPNGRGIGVRVATGRRAGPLKVLADAGIAVEDLRIAVEDLRVVGDDARVAVEDLRVVGDDPRVAVEDLHVVGHDARRAAEDSRMPAEDPRVEEGRWTPM